MIHYIKRENLNVSKYNKCVNNAINSRIYALSYYLDIVADNWDALVLDDYIAVMPLPWRSKYLLKYIYPPCWTQQLGVFSTEEITKELTDCFLKTIPKKFIKKTILLNTHCTSSYTSEVKNNYVLNLNKPYPDLKKEYRKGRKRSVKKFQNSSFKISHSKNITDLITLFKNNYQHGATINNDDYQKLKLLSLESKLNPIVLKIHNSNGDLISGSLLFKDSKRIYYLFSANNPEGNNIKGNSANINTIIENYAETNYTLDFEGSMIPGIAYFFESFGSKIENYSLYTSFLN